jgi:glycosyltransferase involved in cell wall biosynthesis
VRVAFDSRPAHDPRGIGRYVRCLLAALRATAAAGDEVVEAPRPPGECDLFHSPWIDGALVRARAPQVVTVHDLVPLKRPAEYLRTGVRFRLRYLAVKRADRVIVPTGAVRDDVCERLGVEPDRVDVIGEAAAPAFHARPPHEVQQATRRHGIDGDYLLWVGGLQHPDPRKRVAELAALPRRLPLVLAGPASAWARELPGVVLTGAVPDDELAALYTGARALVFPSDEEGFGLPPVEALACGTPVVACDVPGVREVLEGRAVLVPADDLEGLVRAAERDALSAGAPLARTWEDAGRQTWQTYLKVVNHSSTALQPKSGRT